MIDSLKSEDYGSAFKLMADLAYDMSESQFRKNLSTLQDQGAKIYAAKIDGELVGLIVARFSVGILEGEFGEIVALVVSGGHRREGIGEALVCKAEDWLFSRVDTILVRSNALREEAHQFYPALEYSHVKTQKLYKKLA